MHFEKKCSDQEFLRTARRNWIITAASVAFLALAAFYYVSLSDTNSLTSPSFVYHEDEQAIIRRAARMVLSGDWNPHFFRYPTLVIYTHAAAFKLLRVTQNIPLELAVLPAPDVLITHPEAFPVYYTAHLVTAGFSIGALCALLYLASRVCPPPVSLVPGLMFVGGVITNRSASFATVDMPLAFFVTSSLALMVAFVDSAERGEQKLRYLWYAVVLGGMAAGAKYNGALVLLTVPWAMWLARTPIRKVAWHLPLMAILSIVVFVATSPYCVLDWKTFVDSRQGITFEFLHYSSNNFRPQSNSFLSAMKDLFHDNSLFPLALLYPLGMGTTVYRKSPILLGFTSLLFIGIVSAFKTYFQRNLLPAIPALDCLITLGIWTIVVKISSRSRRPTRAAVVGAIIVNAFALIVAGKVMVTTWSQSKLIDNRTLAYEWIVENLPAGSRVLYEAHSPVLHHLPRVESRYVWMINNVPIDEIVKNYDFVVVNEVQWSRFFNLRYKTYEPLFNNYPLLHEWPSIPGRTRGPAVRIYATNELGSGLEL